MSRAKEAYKITMEAEANEAAHKQATMDQGNGINKVAELIDLLSKIQNTQQNSLDLQKAAFAALGVDFESFASATFSGLENTLNETPN